MKADSKRTYTVGDIYYFRRWYESELSAQEQHEVKILVADKQLEFVHGGAVSTDEAAVSFHDIIDNMVVARHWLLQEFGVHPDVGWQLDPFGHSASNARIFAEIGINALVFARMPYTQLMDWAHNQKKDVIWEPGFATTSSQSPALFTHVLFDHYSAPDGIPLFNGGNAMKNT